MLTSKHYINQPSRHCPPSNGLPSDKPQTLITCTPVHSPQIQVILLLSQSLFPFQTSFPSTRQKLKCLTPLVVVQRTSPKWKNPQFHCRAYNHHDCLGSQQSHHFLLPIPVSGGGGSYHSLHTRQNSTDRVWWKRKESFIEQS